MKAIWVSHAHTVGLVEKEGYFIMMEKYRYQKIDKGELYYNELYYLWFNCHYSKELVKVVLGIIDLMDEDAYFYLPINEIAPMLITFGLNENLCFVIAPRMWDETDKDVPKILEIIKQSCDNYVNKQAEITPQL